MSLPSGQDVAQAMDVTPLKDEELKVGKATTRAEYEALPLLTDFDDEFIGNAPLWYYILAEAQNDWYQKLVNANAGPDDGPDTPVQLGDVGSRIVVETLVGILLDDGHSVLRQAPGWVPAIGKQKDFDMPDFIKYALQLE
ncbi:hypothetical protein [Spirosoma telluris]|uniref:hypothetical protein n=1 Tax=Spirosoma telluris TaxID=2183553 RepID=UPI0018DE1140